MTEQEFLNKLSDLRSEIVSKKRRLEDYKLALNFNNATLNNQQSVMTKEQADVYKLDKVSVGNLFKKMTGKMESAQEKEEHELLEARMKYDELKNSISLIEKDIFSLQKSIS